MSHQDKNDTRIQQRRETLRQFSAAWNAGDVDGLLSVMGDNPVYRGSTGHGPGSVFEGHDEVRAALETMVRGNTADADNAAPEPEMYIFEDRALVFWTLELTDQSGQRRAVDGVDVFTFTDDGRIAIKDAYRKAFA